MMAITNHDVLNTSRIREYYYFPNCTNNFIILEIRQKDIILMFQRVKYLHFTF